MNLHSFRNLKVIVMLWNWSIRLTNSTKDSLKTDLLSNLQELLSATELHATRRSTKSHQIWIKIFTGSRKGLRLVQNMLSHRCSLTTISTSTLLRELEKRV